MLIAALPAILRPVAHLAAVKEWKALRSPSLFDAPAVIIAVVCALLWWFWLIRLANTVPHESRRPVSRCFMLWTPMITVVVLGGVAFGLYTFATRLGSSAGLAW
jgi:hypothetical protein